MSEYENYDDYNDLEEDFDPYTENKLTVGKVIKKVFLYSLRLLALGVFAFLMFRILSSGDPKSMKEFIWTSPSIEAYTENPSEFEAFYYKHPDNLSKDGKFAASYIYFVPKTGQFQITVRYNNSTLKYLAEDYKLGEKPQGEVFVYVLTDNLGNTYTDYEYFSDTKNIYNYQRLVFNGIDLNATKTVEEDEKLVTKKFETLTLTVYYKDDVVLSTPYGVLPVYDSEYYHEPINLDKFSFKDNKPTHTLTSGVSYTVKEEPTETQK